MCPLIFCELHRETPSCDVPTLPVVSVSLSRVVSRVVTCVSTRSRVVSTSPTCCLHKAGAIVSLSSM